ncbi:MlaD family protein [Nocardioides marmoribigeumensis]|uniref:Phospholipid/cholesterol/gamma-HCH transport system substrate-binding protein n=1 Tax=Nocardioides marmoribigeumensis TaxID=433649 RepID=A0ABU2BVB5_9ACTN|nr:MlaD family protein [Nocardioides marmoribigeumensis]MDR7362568.1 phospholipid/cholesterol/gamma-HCH transport system substrate-binding protein [Nocardioides marmoribigeumensis]
MITRRVRLQLLVFALVTVVVVWYGATRYLGIGEVIDRPYTVSMQVASSGGLYPRADVDLLGTRVGRVQELEPGPGLGTTVVLALDHDVKVPQDVRGTVAAKSAIGEGYVLLTPQSAGGPDLEDGDTIPLSRTTSPIRLEKVLGDLDALARSVPKDDLAVVLRESEAALDGIAPSVGRLVDGSQKLSQDALDNVETTTALIRDARTVLGTQVALGGETRTYAGEVAGLTRRFRELDPTAISLYDTGLRASTQVTNLLADNQPVLPVLLSNLLSLTTVASERIPEIRKTLVVFPWVLENQVNTARYCDDYDPKTGKPVQDTCHYDKEGKPIYTLHLAQQLDKMGADPYQSCTRGYEGTTRYRPDGEQADGNGRRQPRSSEPNLRAHCAAPPSDPVSPNVRGSQNVTTPSYARQGSGSGATAPGRAPMAPMAMYDPATGLVTDGDVAVRLSGERGDAPPIGSAGLAWLLTSPLGDG